MGATLNLLFSISFLFLFLFPSETSSPTSSSSSPPVIFNPRYPYGRFRVVSKPELPRLSIFGPSPTPHTLKIFGIGLAKTRTTSLAQFFASLGLRVVQLDPDFTLPLPHSSTYRWNWTGIYDDIDAVFEKPACYHYKELASIYPQALFLGFYRKQTEWLNSSINFFKKHLGNNTCQSAHLLDRVQHPGYERGKTEEEQVKLYELHYQSVRDFFHLNPSSSHRLLELSWDEPNPAKKICQFIKIPDMTLCPIFPHENNVKTQVRAPPPFPCIVIPTNSSFAYATALDQPSPETFRAVLVWCEAIRISYANQRTTESFDIVLLTLKALNETETLLLEECIDHILHVKPFGQDPRGFSFKDSDFRRAKFWIFGLHQNYKRVIYLDYHQLVIQNLDHYFFRAHYLSNTAHNLSSIFSNAEQFLTSGLEVPRLLPFYGLMGTNSPINSQFFTAEPSKARMTDFWHLLSKLRNWNPVTGWLDYGKFELPEPLTLNLRNPKTSKRVRPAPRPSSSSHSEVFPPVRSWNLSTWDFEFSGLDQGALFYYFILFWNHTKQKREQGGYLEPGNVEYEIVPLQNVSSLSSPKATFSGLQEQNFEISPAMQYWLKIAEYVNEEFDDSLVADDEDPETETDTDTDQEGGADTDNEGDDDDGDDTGATPPTLPPLQFFFPPSPLPSSRSSSPPPYSSSSSLSSIRPLSSFAFSATHASLTYYSCSFFSSPLVLIPLAIMGFVLFFFGYMVGNKWRGRNCVLSL